MESAIHIRKHEVFLHFLLESTNRQRFRCRKLAAKNVSGLGKVPTRKRMEWL
jgi:hypothetical protein